ncbi:MAG: hypothetical protein PHG04_02780 [Candidatus Nanoarchaeia archaeon]|nr:hypothetical protein [Candidatus Nanoarchaeia archaeon]MDD5054277.1 hypothetical protein [Candidatus Nanoarchaeia archaeon]
MKITKTEKKALKKRLNQLKSYMAESLKKNRLDEYLNAMNSRELRMLENVLIKDDILKAMSIGS